MLVSWAVQSSSAANYKVQWAPANSSYDDTNETIVNSGQLSASISGLTPGVNYKFQITVLMVDTYSVPAERQAIAKLAAPGADTGKWRHSGWRDAELGGRCLRHDGICDRFK